MTYPLYLVLGDSAAGCLRLACRSHGMPGMEFCIPDDLSHGPLEDGYARIDYMRNCHRGYKNWTHKVSDAFIPWHRMVAQIDQERPEFVVIWTGENVAGVSFLAMACLYSSRRELSAKERGAFSLEYERIRTQTGLLRQLERVRVIGLPEDYYDHFLLEACPPEWAPAPRVVGAAMARCRRQNLMSNLFFSSRLQSLIASGRIQSDSVPAQLRDYFVRRQPLADAPVFSSQP